MCRIEQYPPWDTRSQWHKLRQNCLDFKASLPRQHSLTPQNTQAHISLKTSTPYTLVHTVYLLCQIMLHREYVPFIPIRCSKPEGPLDKPTFPPNEYNVPPNFWDESARECFRSAREIMDLVGICQEWNVLVETPIVGFAIYTVAFVGVYCINFAWMDPDGYMCTKPTPAGTAYPSGSSRPAENMGFEAARQALELTGNMGRRLHMAVGWFDTITKMHKYFQRMKKDYRKNVQANGPSPGSDDSPLSTRNLSLREGGEGGGLDEFKVLERTLKDFGRLEDLDVEMTDATLLHGARAADLYDDSSAGTTVKSEEPDHRTASTEHQRADGGPWNAINTAPGAVPSRQPSISTPSSAPFRSYDSYPPQHQTTAQPLGQHPSYAHQINSFRPAYPADTPGPGQGAPPSLTSPASHSASTTSQPSPPFERQPSYGGWTPQNTNTSYPMAPPQAGAYGNTNGVAAAPHHHHAHHAPQQPQYPPSMPNGGPGAGATSYQPTPQHQQQAMQHAHQQQHLQPAPQLHEPLHAPAVWDHLQKEQWLNSLPTDTSADDLAAFIDGSEVGDWAARNEYGQTGWLTTLWGGASG